MAAYLALEPTKKNYDALEQLVKEKKIKSEGLILVQKDKDGTLSGNAGCNEYSGPYTVTGNQIKIGPLTSTMMACSDPAGVMD
jgi:heat shock protein HslJ